jgi:hypothetical protein
MTCVAQRRGSGTTQNQVRKEAPPLSPLFLSYPCCLCSPGTCFAYWIAFHFGSQLPIEARGRGGGAREREKGELPHMPDWNPNSARCLAQSLVLVPLSRGTRPSPKLSTSAPVKTGRPLPQGYPLIEHGGRDSTAIWPCCSQTRAGTHGPSPIITLWPMRLWGPTWQDTSGPCNSCASCHPRPKVPPLRNGYTEGAAVDESLNWPQALAEFWASCVWPGAFLSTSNPRLFGRKRGGLVATTANQNQIQTPNTCVLLTS